MVNRHGRVFWPEEACPSEVETSVVEEDLDIGFDPNEAIREIVISPDEGTTTITITEPEPDVNEINQPDHVLDTLIKEDPDLEPTPIVEPMKHRPKPIFGSLNKRRARNMFDIFDKNRNGKIAIFEIYTMFSSADKNQDFSLTPEELVSWLVKNSKTICRPYRRII